MPSADSADAEVVNSTGTMPWSRGLSICLVQRFTPAANEDSDRCSGRKDLSGRGPLPDMWVPESQP
jgi:hypothetical protein